MGCHKTSMPKQGRGPVPEATLGGSSLRLLRDAHHTRTAWLSVYPGNAGYRSRPSQSTLTQLLAAPNLDWTHICIRQLADCHSSSHPPPLLLLFNLDVGAVRTVIALSSQNERLLEDEPNSLSTQVRLGKAVFASSLSLCRHRPEFTCAWPNSPSQRRGKHSITTQQHTTTQHSSLLFAAKAAYTLPSFDCTTATTARRTPVHPHSLSRTLAIAPGADHVLPPITTLRTLATGNQENSSAPLLVFKLHSLTRPPTLRRSAEHSFFHPSFLLTTLSPFL